MLRRRGSYAETAAAFRWEIPARYNMGRDLSTRWAAQDPERLAILDLGVGDTPPRALTFAALDDASSRLASALSAAGIRGGVDGRVGDRIGVLLPQRAETAIAHIAAWKLGAVSLPLFTLFGPDALRHRLSDAGAAVVITDQAGVGALASLRSDLADLRLVLSVDGAAPGVDCYAAALTAGDPTFAPADTAADDPALLIYTSGTTGNPKGALHAHRVLLGHLPGVEMSHDFLPQPGDRLWTPADWAWIGGLLDVLGPGLHHGAPVVARRFQKFTAEAAVALMRDHGVRNVFLPPTALKMIRAAYPEPGDDGLGLALRSVAAGGESLGAELLDWGRRAFGLTINEFYGQTECNMVVSACAALEPPAPGAMGRPAPGHRVRVIDATTGAEQPAGAEGALAVGAPDPVMFLGYWNNASATEEKFVTNADGARWLLTGDRGVADTEGRFAYVGRDDDVISSAGYRIGPGEVENCLLEHPAVSLAGVVGAPDPIRGHVVAAYIVLRPGWTPSKPLADDIARFVKARLAAHEYPRIIRFLDQMPLTTTGKILRRELRAQAAADTAPDQGSSG